MVQSWVVRKHTAARRWWAVWERYSQVAWETWPSAKRASTGKRDRRSSSPADCEASCDRRLPNWRSLDLRWGPPSAGGDPTTTRWAAVGSPPSRRLPSRARRPPARTEIGRVLRALRPTTRRIDLPAAGTTCSGRRRAAAEQVRRRSCAFRKPVRWTVWSRWSTRRAASRRRTETGRRTWAQSRVLEAASPTHWDRPTRVSWDDDRGSSAGRSSAHTAGNETASPVCTVHRRFLPRDAMLAPYTLSSFIRLSVRHKPALYENG